MYLKSCGFDLSIQNDIKSKTVKDLNVKSIIDVKIM